MSTRKSQELAAQVDLGVLDGLLSFYVRVFEIAVSRHLDNRLAPLGFKGRKGTISSLLLIAHHEGIRPTTIATLLGIDKSITIKTIDELRRAKFVTRRSAECPSSNDLRLFGLWKNGVSGSICVLI